MYETPERLWVRATAYSMNMTHHAASSAAKPHFQSEYVRGDIYRAAIERAEKAEAALEDK